MEPSTPKYDVAISFLSQDQPIAEALFSRLSMGLKVFFYPRNQEELAGTDGMESMRRPFMEESRVTVVLYRERWGKTPWTRVEESAIKDGCLAQGWHRLFFMPLDDAAVLPVWLPHTHVRFSFTSFGIEQAVGAIKARVQECGGVIAPVTAIARARLIHAEALHLKKKETLFGSQQWIHDYVLPSISSLFSGICDLAAKISSELSLDIVCRSSTNICGLTNGRVSLSVHWTQQYTNVMATLKLTEFHERIVLPGERRMYLSGRAPPEMTVHVFMPDLALDETLCWFDESKHDVRLSTADVADAAMQIFLTLVGHANRGEIDTTSEFYRQIQDGWQERD